MPRVHFTQDHDHTPVPAQTIAYKAGQTYLVSQAVAAEAVALGRGVIMPSPGETRPAGSVAPANEEPARLDARGADPLAVERIERGLEDLRRTLPRRGGADGSP